MKQCDGQLALFEEDMKTKLLREELTQAPFCGGKLDIEEFFIKNQPEDTELADFLRKHYGIGGHSGPGMPHVDYDAKGIRIRTRDTNQDFRYSWKEVAKMIRKCISEDSYVTPHDVKELVYHYLFYLQEGWDVEWCTDNLAKLINHPKLTIRDQKRLNDILQRGSRA